ncbi:MAG: NUDIX domain-containing protein [bacterium]|nr:NUDIX domain-containing protein [bacterium]
MTIRTHNSRRRSRPSNRRRAHGSPTAHQIENTRLVETKSSQKPAGGEHPSTGSLAKNQNQRKPHPAHVGSTTAGIDTKSSRKKSNQKRRRGFRRELSSGGIIYRNREDQIEFFFIRDPYGRWTFPKGHQELGETLIETAIREIDEETGLRGLQYIANLGKTRFRFSRGRTMVEKTVHLYLFEISPQRKEKLPGTEGIHEAQWFPLEKAKKMSGYRNLDRLLAKAVYLARKQENPEVQKEEG